jgi:hypothetical protein
VLGGLTLAALLSSSADVALISDRNAQQSHGA